MHAALECRFSEPAEQHELSVTLCACGMVRICPAPRGNRVSMRRDRAAAYQPGECRAPLLNREVEQSRPVPIIITDQFRAAESELNDELGVSKERVRLFATGAREDPLT